MTGPRFDQGVPQADLDAARDLHARCEEDAANTHPNDPLYARFRRDERIVAALVAEVEALRGENTRLRGLLRDVRIEVREAERDLGDVSVLADALETIFHHGGGGTTRRPRGRDVRFYLGTHRAGWLAATDVDLFVSRRQLADRRMLPIAAGRWALDSGGFTELALHREWTISEADYALEVERYAQEIGGLEWAAPMDWMCEPSMLAKTGVTVSEHQLRTTGNLLRLRDRLGALVIPVLQGWTLDDYWRHADQYEAAGVDLHAEPLVGVGSVCRREKPSLILRPLAEAGLSLHGFGVKSAHAADLTDVLASADSLAWSAQARWAGRPMLPGCTHRTCANCMAWALTWRGGIVRRADQLRMEIT